MTSGVERSGGSVPGAGTGVPLPEKPLLIAKAPSSSLSPIDFYRHFTASDLKGTLGFDKLWTRDGLGFSAVAAETPFAVYPGLISGGNLVFPPMDSNAPPLPILEVEGGIRLFANDKDALRDMAEGWLHKQFRHRELVESLAQRALTAAFDNEELWSALDGLFADVRLSCGLYLRSDRRLEWRVSVPKEVQKRLMERLTDLPNHLKRELKDMLAKPIRGRLADLTPCDHPLHRLFFNEDGRVKDKVPLKEVVKAVKALKTEKPFFTELPERLQVSANGRISESVQLGRDPFQNLVFSMRDAPLEGLSLVANLKEGILIEAETPNFPFSFSGRRGGKIFDNHGLVQLGVSNWKWADRGPLPLGTYPFRADISVDSEVVSAFSPVTLRDSGDLVFSLEADDLASQISRLRAEGFKSLVPDILKSETKLAVADRAIASLVLEATRDIPDVIPTGELVMPPLLAKILEIRGQVPRDPDPRSERFVVAPFFFKTGIPKPVLSILRAYYADELKLDEFRMDVMGSMAGGEVSESEFTHRDWEDLGKGIPLLKAELKKYYDVLRRLGQPLLNDSQYVSAHDAYWEARRAIETRYPAVRYARISGGWVGESPSSSEKAAEAKAYNGQDLLLTIHSRPSKQVAGDPHSGIRQSFSVEALTPDESGDPILGIHGLYNETYLKPAIPMGLAYVPAFAQMTGFDVPTDGPLQGHFVMRSNGVDWGTRLKDITRDTLRSFMMDITLPQIGFAADRLPRTLKKALSAFLVGWKVESPNNQLFSFDEGTVTEVRGKLSGTLDLGEVGKNPKRLAVALSKSAQLSGRYDSDTKLLTASVSGKESVVQWGENKFALKGATLSLSHDGKSGRELMAPGNALHVTGAKEAKLQFGDHRVVLKNCSFDAVTDENGNVGVENLVFDSGFYLKKSSSFSISLGKISLGSPLSLHHEKTLDGLSFEGKNLDIEVGELVYNGKVKGDFAVPTLNRVHLKGDVRLESRREEVLVQALSNGSGRRPFSVSFQAAGGSGEVSALGLRVQSKEVVAKKGEKGKSGKTWHVEVSSPRAEIDANEQGACNVLNFGAESMVIDVAESHLRGLDIERGDLAACLEEKGLRVKMKVKPLQ